MLSGIVAVYLSAYPGPVLCNGDLFTHTSKAIRQAAFNNIPSTFLYLLPAAIGIIYFSLALKCVGRARD